MSPRTAPPRDERSREEPLARAGGACGPSDPPRSLGWSGGSPASGVGQHRRLILAAVAVVVLAVIVTWLLAFSPVFGVRTVTVRGTQQLTAAQVEKAARIAHGTPLLRLDRAAIEHRVEALPGVAAARVSTSFPSTVTVSVTERVPIGYVHTTDGYALVDKTGDQFQTETKAPAGLPHFVVPSGTSARTTGGAVATVAAALPAKLRAKVESIQALDPQAISLVLRGGVVVQWGGADRSADKARILPALLARGAPQIDVSDPGLPFTR